MREQTPTNPARKVGRAVTITMAVFLFTIALVAAAKPAEGKGTVRTARSGYWSKEGAQRRLPAVEPHDQLGSPNAATSTLGTIKTAAHSTSSIDVWYGLNQSFGHIGIPQKWVNILGNVSGQVNSFYYRLNGGAQVDLSVGPDNRRLESPGDFNIDIDRSLLSAGSNNEVVIYLNNQPTATVNVTYADNNAWPLPYFINWSDVTDIQDVAQVVDGLWSVSPAGIRTDIIGYDRLVAIGGLPWTDYEVKVPITVHSVNSGGNPPGVGVLMRWPGHNDDPPPDPPCSQPLCGYVPNGNLGWFRFRSDENLEFLDPFASIDFSSFQQGTTYWFKIRVETKSGVNSDYKMWVWEDGDPEPSFNNENLSVVEISEDQPTGSFLLTAHQADATFGNVSVVPVNGTTYYSLEVDEVGNGDVVLDPPGGIYEAGTVVKLTPMPDSGRYFEGWSGPDASDPTDNGDGTWSITMDGDKSIIATFAEGATLNLNIVGQGSVELVPVPSGDTYPIGTQVTLRPIPDPSWSFKSWSGPNAVDLTDNGDGTWSLEMDNDKSITATFITQHQVLIPVIEKP